MLHYQYNHQKSDENPPTVPLQDFIYHNINIIFQKIFMESQPFIKIQQQPPVESTSNIINRCMNHFYDEDSFDPLYNNQQDPFQETILDNQTIVSHLEEVTDLRITPLEELLDMARNMFPNIIYGNLESLRKYILRKKSILKRNYAKNRKEQYHEQKGFYVISDIPIEITSKEDIQTELKKKRNRMSAQISRDRKKMKLKELETSHNKLMEETQKMRKENQKLKKQLQNFNESNKQKEKNVQNSRPQRNKLVSLLVMLGLFFLFSILKDAKPSNKLESKISKPKSHTLSTDFQSKLVEKTQKMFFEIEENPQQALFDDRQSLDLVLNKLNELKINTEELEVEQSLGDKIKSVSAQLL